MAKNTGPLLTDKIRGTLEVLPAWVRRFVKYTITRQKVDAKVPLDPDPLTATLVASELRQEVTDERNKINTELDPTALPATRTGELVLPNGQVGTVTEIVDDAPQSLVEGPLLEEGDVENIGDISMLRKVEAPSVFDNALYAKAREDSVLPARFRASIAEETTRLDSAGTAAPPTLGAGDVQKISEQIRVGVVRNTTVGRNLAGASSLPGSVTTSEFNGTVANVLESIVAQGTLADSGENIISSSVESLGDGVNAVKSTVSRNPAESDWPEVIEYEFDPRSEITFEIKKKVVPAATVTAPSVAGLVSTEYKALERWRSIRIITTIPSNILSQTIVKSIARRHDFPYQVTRCVYVVAVKRTNFTAPGSGTISNEVSSFDIALDVAYKGGYSGPVEARVTETFTTNPNAALPTIFTYKTIGGTLCLGYVMSGISLSGANVRTFSIRESLHDVLDPTPPTIANFAFGAFIVGTLTSSAIDWAPSDGIPASSPITLNTGDWIVVDVNKEKWRNGVYVSSVLEVKVPTL